MSRVSIEFPEEVLFSTEITMHNAYINSGNHVGNSNYVELCNEASLRFFRSRDVPQYTIGEQVLLNTAFSVKLASEAKYCDILVVDLGVDNFHRSGCDFIYRFSQKENLKLVAMARFSFLSFDYKRGVVVPVSDDFRHFFHLEG